MVRVEENKNRVTFPCTISFIVRLATILPPAVLTASPTDLSSNAKSRNSSVVCFHRITYEEII